MQPTLEQGQKVIQLEAQGFKLTGWLHHYDNSRFPPVQTGPAQEHPCCDKCSPVFKGPWEDGKLP